MSSEKDKESKEELVEMQEIIRDVSVSYRLYLLSRRDFLLGILIGVSGSIIAGYIVQLDLLLFSGKHSVIGLILRLGVLFSVLIYVVLSFRKRTEDYKRAVEGMLERNKQISEKIRDREE